jgi:branched-chain amino acid transport system permease protein
VGLLAKHGLWHEPMTSLLLAALVAATVGCGAGAVLLRTHGLTLLLLTRCTMALLAEAAHWGHEYTGGFDGLDSLPIAPLFGVFEFNPLYPKTPYLYVLAVLWLCFVFVRTRVYSPFGESLTGLREHTRRM